MNLFWTLLLCALGFQSTVQLLPKTVIPLNYRLELNPIFGNIAMFNNKNYFKGKVAITIKCLEKTNTITLHAKNIRLLSGTVTHRHNRLNFEGLSDIRFDREGDLATLHLPGDLEKDNVYRLDIGFKRNFEEVLKEGFFLSSSKNPSTDETVYNATSYLQNGNARKVFPCFDEPEYKTPFEIVIGHTKKYKAISNMPEDHNEFTHHNHGIEWIKTYFKKTAPLSTDQVTFSVFKP